MAACGFWAGIHQNPCLKRCFFFFLLISNLAEILADWLLYYSVKSLGKGLVYGPIPSDLVTAILVFAICGTLLYPLELVNAALKTFRDRCWVQVDVMSAFVLWLTDVPQITVNVIIASCREEQVTDFQLAKGGVVIAGCAIRLAIVITRYCSTKQMKGFRDDTPKTRCRVAARYLVIIGLKISCIGSVLIFIFSQFHLYNGAVLLNYPERHFDKVGIFVDQNAIFLRTDLNGTKWLKVSNIQAAMNPDRDLVVRLRVEKTAGTPRLTIANNANSQNLSVKLCYQLSLVPELRVTDILQTTSCTDVTGKNSSDTWFRFRYMEPEDSFLVNSHLFGDIIFNEKRDYTNDTFPATDGYSGPLRYFRYRPNPSSSSDDLMYSQEDLTDTKEVWRNGYFGCDASGSLVPNKDPDLVVSETLPS